MPDEGSHTKVLHEYKDVDLQKPGQVVMTLMNSLLNFDHLAGIDNHYTDLVLLNLLKRNGTDCAGAVRANRRYFPKDVIGKSWTKSDRDQIISAHTSTVILMNWMDRREVRIAATTGSLKIEGEKPSVVHLYNKAMPGVDTADQMRSGRGVARDRLRDWDKKVFMYLLDVALVNAFIISKHITTLAGITHRSFRVTLVKSLYYRFKPRMLLTEVISNNSEMTRLSERHTAIEKVQHHNARRTCVVCKIKTYYLCNDCGKFMCPER